MNPLPLPLCWGYLAQVAATLGVHEVARKAAKVLVNRLASSDHARWALVAGAGPGGGAGPSLGTYAAPLTSHLDAALLMRPSLLDRAPRASLQALAQVPNLETNLVLVL